MTAATPPASAQSAPTSRPESPRDADAARASHFIRQAVDTDLETGQYARRLWSGRPGPASLQLGSARDPAPIRTRFPPEPNGYLHIGHAKSICLNFGLALDYAGRCHMRFDDTNPVKEDQEYVDGILDTVRWLGFSWDTGGEDNLYFASDYFGWFYEIAEHLGIPIGTVKSRIFQARQRLMEMLTDKNVTA